jgi:hypothetical protein
VLSGKWRSIVENRLSSLTVYFLDRPNAVTQPNPPPRGARAPDRARDPGPDRTEHVRAKRQGVVLTTEFLKTVVSKAKSLTLTPVLCYLLYLEPRSVAWRRDTNRNKLNVPRGTVPFLGGQRCMSGVGRHASSVWL